MNLEEIKEMLAFNHEAGTLCMSKSIKAELLSHSSLHPDKYYHIKTDNAFARKARLLQAMRRFQTGAPCGAVEKNGVTYYHPNLAKDGHISGCNFLHHDIFEYAKKRVEEKKPYETINGPRLFNNFLSSQPMAFNLFYPLMVLANCQEGRAKLAKVVSQLIDPDDAMGINEITGVGIEFIPDYYPECLNDKTAMDAYMRYATRDGKKGIIAIETKYTDMLGKNAASNPAPAIHVATDNHDIAQLFTMEARKKIQAGEIKLSQVFRNFLLTETVRLHEKLDDSLSIVLSPRENCSNKEDEALLQASLNKKYSYKFQAISLECFVDALIEEFPEEPIFKSFHHRYLEFQVAEWFLENEFKDLSKV